MSLKQGEVIAGRYRLDRLLGEGGMGSVWGATHTVTGKAVAVKFLKGELAMNASVVQRFLREARAACAVRHPNVVQIHDVLTLDSGAPAMVMDLLDGESLGAKLAREQRLSVAEFARTMMPVVAAVASAHAASIVHRDLKPENLFLTRNPEGPADIKVLDFGIAKINASDQEGGQLTKTGSMLGTPFYMSPEQLFGEKDLDGRSDTWSLGIIFYECLSGILPTHAENLGQIIKTVTATGITPLATVAPDVPLELSSLVQRMLSRERNARPTLDEIRAVIARYTGETHSPNAPESPVDANALRDELVGSPNASRRIGPTTGDIQWGSTQDLRIRSRAHPIAALIGATAAVLLGVTVIMALPRLRERFSSSKTPAAATAPSSSTAPRPLDAPSAALAEVPSSTAASPAIASASIAKSAPPTMSSSSSAPTNSAPTKRPPSPAQKPTATGLLEEKVPF
jgi:serine/threonine-protein kinase